MPKPYLSATLLVLALLLAPGATLAQPGIATPNNTWTNTCVECPKLVRSMSPHCLRLDAQGQPHIVYGGDDLYYAFYDGAAWRIETVDDAPGSVAYPSLALTRDGTPHVSYAVPGSVMHAWRDPQGWRVEAIGATGPWQPQTAVAVDSRGFPVVVYSRMLEYSSRELVVARQDASGWQLTYPLPGESNVGWLSLALDGNDRPHVAYVRFYVDDIKYAYEDATGWHVEAVETRVSSKAWSTSLALGADGEPWLAYGLYANRVKVAYRDASGWHSETVGTGGFPSLVTDETGRPALSYIAENGLIYSTRAATGWHGDLVDPAATLDLFSLLALDAAGGAHLAYFDLATATLRYARPDGASWAIEAVDSASDVGRHSALALDAAGRGHAGYYDATRGAVKYAVQDQGGWRVEMVDTDASAYYERTGISLALDGQGQPHLSYTDATSKAVRYAFRTGSAWQIETIDPQAGQLSSVALALDASGVPHVAYQDVDQGYHIIMATRDDGWHLEVVAAGGVYSRAKPALVFDAAGSPYLAFVTYTGTGMGVTVATRDPGASAWDLEFVAAVDSGDYSLAVAMDANGVPHVAWGSSDPPDQGTVHYAVREATGWWVETVDAGGDMTGIALSLNPDGHPFIAVTDIGFDYYTGVYYLIQLRVCYRDAAGWHVEIPELPEQRPYSPSLALDQAGRPHVSYYDAANGDLRLVVRSVPPPITSTPPASLPWRMFCIDCPRAFDSTGDHGLQADSQGRLHMAYGGDHLYYATFDGATWLSAVVDAAPGVGQGASLALDASGAPSIAYYDAVHGDLKFAWLEEGAWHNETVESNGDVGRLASLAMDHAGNPHIGYYDSTQQRLRYATHSTMGWQLDTVVDQWIADISLVMSVDDGLHMAFVGAESRLWYASYDGVEWQLEAVGEPQLEGGPISLAMDSAGQPHIAFGQGDDLRYAWRDVSGWQVDDVVAGGAQSVSLALDGVDAPHISYRYRRDQYGEYELRYVTRNYPGNEWNTETIDTSDALSDKLVSLTVDGAGAAHILYLVENVLTLASHGPQGGWRLQVVDESTSAQGSDLAVDRDAQVHTSYTTSGARGGRWYAVGDGAGWQREAVVASLEVTSQASGQSSGSAGRRISIDASGAPHLAYSTFYRSPIDPQGNHYDLWYAHKDLVSGQWSIESPDPLDGGGPAMALDGAGLPHIAYSKGFDYSYYREELYYAVRCGNAWCNELADSGGSGYYLGGGASVAIDSEGRPYVSYLGYNGDGYDQQLRLAIKDAMGWHVELVAEYVETHGTKPSLALDAGGKPMIAFAQNYDLLLALKEGEDWHNEVVDGAGSVSGSIELALDSQGQPHIGYFNDGHLRYAVRDSLGWQLYDVNPAGLPTGQSAGFVLGPGDTPYFAVTDPWSQDYLLVTTASPAARIWLPLLYKQ